MPDLWRRLSAEALGTGLLVATVVGSGIMAERLTDDVGLALLANALPTAAMLVVLITLLGPISGAHLNPAVTLVLALRGDIERRISGLYGAAQIAGGLAGVLVSHLMFGAGPLQLAQQVRSGPAQWFSEAVATLGLVLVVLLGQRQRHRTALPALVGLYIGSAYWFTASTSFANPAVTLARAFTDSFSGIGLSHVPGFVLAQLAGAFIGLALASWLQPPLPQDANP